MTDRLSELENRISKLEIICKAERPKEVPPHECMFRWHEDKCAICGAGGQKEARKLEAIIFDMGVEMGEQYSIPVHRIGFSGKIAKACIDAVEEVIEDYLKSEHLQDLSGYRQEVGNLKQAIRERLL